jgi:endonuclease/exonuclease/phosphatase family metal-dependent hydrolase
MNLKQVVTAACLVLVAYAVEGAEPLTLRVLSYNIHHAEGADGKLDVERIANVIRSVEPDLVALQEVDEKVNRTNSIDQPAELARLTKMHVAFGANLELQGGRYGNALLSRYPILRHQRHLLPNADRGEQRGVIEAEFEAAPSGQRLRFFATHLDHRNDNRERLASAKELNRLAATHSDVPTLLAGDLNDTPESEVLKELSTDWTQANSEALATVPVDKPTKQIDFILFRTKDRWKVIEVKVLDESVGSDHRAILAVLELAPNEFPSSSE